MARATPCALLPPSRLRCSYLCCGGRRGRRFGTLRRLAGRASWVGRLCLADAPRLLRRLGASARHNLGVSPSAPPTSGLREIRHHPLSPTPCRLRLPCRPRPSSQKRCPLGAPPPAGLFVGYRRHDTAAWPSGGRERRPRLGGFRNLPPPAGALATAFTSAGFSILCCGHVLALRARRRLTRRPAGGAPPPRPCARRGAPVPLLLVPAPYGRAPAGSRGLRESGSRGWATPNPSPFLSATACGGGSCGWVLRPRVGSGWCSSAVAPAGGALRLSHTPSRRIQLRFPHPSPPLRPRFARPRRWSRPRRLPLPIAEIQFQETKSIVLSSIARYTILSLKSNYRMTAAQFLCAPRPKPGPPTTHFS